MPAAVCDLAFPVGDRDKCAGIKRHILDERTQLGRPLAAHKDAHHLPRFINNRDADLEGDIFFSDYPQNYIRYAGFPPPTDFLVPIPMGKVLS